MLTVRFKAKCSVCRVKFEAEKRHLFGLAIRQHEVMTGHRVKIREE
ncbi:hypothetical protein SEA_SHAM4_79 [Mycobacterium phage Sham4]|nr:hypothetical protein SEA_ET2BRUTUS_82 [Mycobacterium phage Et2Brutus]AXC33441.1 hypothetical protein SEA_EBONY_83 [Mycobacterium phage Ebony]AXH50762.1 hypothetical protein SEA_SNAPE_83 [Mycobacterium phage Snape]QBI99105.1 hypothetical protein SEA_SALZ_78 [Mycobacterium phage Salz]QBP32555.1 hypothetical protein SEA_FIBONACCI_82 [Mycobacterium phage Fibonacci]QHJ86591.1 hypothetical protein SEA_MABEL_83 [Mycobacterium phage Mabel]QPX62008.1 hypothetical protein SEA_FLAVERINT_84 [Mycobacte